MAYRKIHIGKDTWEYNVGHTYVHMKGPNGLNFTCKKPEVGAEVKTKEWARWEYVTVTKYAVEPKLIKKYIQDKLKPG